jgi:hypothetical protein
LGDRQERHHDPEQDDRDALGFAAHCFPPFWFALIRLWGEVEPMPQGEQCRQQRQPNDDPE